MRLRDRIAYIIILAWTFAVGAIRGFRLPNDFAECHWLLDYRLGFIKRGLIGTLYYGAHRLTGLPDDAGPIAAISTVYLVMFYLALLAVCWRILTRCVWSGPVRIGLLAFAASPSVVFMAHTNGYFDSLFYLAGFGAGLLVMCGRVWPAAVLLALATLMHELTLVLVLPAVGLCALLDNSRRLDEDRRPVSLWPLAIPVVVYLALAAVNAMRPANQLYAAYSEVFFAHPFIEGKWPDWNAYFLTVSLGEYLRGQSPYFAGRLFSTMGLMALPSIVVMVWGAMACLRVRLRSSRGALVLAAVAGIQVLHVIAFDTMRIWTFSIMTGLLVMWIAAEDARPGPVGSPGLGWVAALALIVNALIDVPLMNGRIDRFETPWRLAFYAPPILLALAVAIRSRCAGDGEAFASRPFALGAALRAGLCARKRPRGN